MNDDVPGLKSLYDVRLDKEGNPTGIRKRYESLAGIAADMTPQGLLNAIAGPDLERQLGGLLLLEKRPCPSGDSEFWSVLARLLASDAVLTWQWGERSYQRRHFGLADLAADTFSVLVGRGVRTPHSLRTGPPLAIQDAERHLIAGVEAGLHRPTGATHIRSLLRAMRALPGSSRSQRDAPIAAALARCARDEAQIAETRWNAANELMQLARQVDEPGALRSSAAEVKDAFLLELGAGRGDVRFRREAQRHLSKLAPDDVVTLQASGVLVTSPTPPVSTLINTWGSVREDKVRAAAPSVVLTSLLSELDADDVQVVAAAMCLLTATVPRVGAEAAAERLVGFLSDPRGFDLPRAKVRGRPDLSGPRTRVELAELAGDRLRRMLTPLLRTGADWSLDVGLTALDRILDAQDGGQRKLRLAGRFADGLRQSRDAGARERTTDLLLEVRNDPERAAAARFAAASLPVKKDPVWTASVVQNPQEDLALRALLGSVFHAWSPEAFWHCVDTWRQSPVLPISQPAAVVPMVWLLESVTATDSFRLRCKLVRQLAGRLEIGRDVRAANSDLGISCLVAASDEVFDVLRSLLAIKGRDLPRWSICTCLAVGGRPEDEARLVECLSERGAWSRVDPSEIIRRDLPLIEQLTLRPLACARPFHMLEPFLRLGYGDALADRMMARTFVELGRKAEAHGSPAAAGHAYRLAVALDELNLDAIRGRNRSK